MAEPPAPRPAGEPGPTGRRGPRLWLERAGAALLGLLVLALAAEATLWAFHTLAAPPDRSAELAPAPGERRILCIGDSNTYGTGLEAHQSYPGQLQELLDRAPDNPWRVVNLGYPGQNSAQLRSRLEQNLEAYRPEIVICWVGVNNSWSPAMRHLWRHPDSEVAALDLEAWLQRSRVLGLVRMVADRVRRRVTGEPEPHRVGGEDVVPGLDGALRGEGLGSVPIGDPGQRERGPPSAKPVSETIRIDLRRIRQLSAEHGAELVLAEYFVDFDWLLRDVNGTIRDFARETGTPHVPLEEGILPLVERLGRETVLQADNHATAISNYEIARLVLETLTGSELLEPRAEWTDLPTLDERLHAYAAEVLEVAADRSWVEIGLAGPPGERWHVRLEGIFAATDEAGGRWTRIVPWQLDPQIAQEAMRDYTSRIRKDGEGHLRIPIPERWEGPAPCGDRPCRLLGWRLTPVAVPSFARQRLPVDLEKVDVMLDRPLEVSR